MDADAWDAKYAEKETVWGFEPNRFVVPVVTDLEPGRALDFACGEGRNAVWLAAHGWDVTAVDFSKVALERGRELARRQEVDVDFVEADVLIYEPPGRFDLVLVLYLQLPPDSRRRALDIAQSAVAHGGRLLVVGHARRNLAEGVGGPQVPELLYDPDTIAAELSADLDVLRAEFVTREVETDAGTRDAIDSLVLARRDVG